MVPALCFACRFIGVKALGEIFPSLKDSEFSARSTDVGKVQRISHRHAIQFVERIDKRAEDVPEVLVCYSLRVSESPSNLQPNRVTS